MDKKTLEQALADAGIAKTGSSQRALILEALKKAGENGLTLEQCAQAGGNKSSKGDTERTVQSAISHLRNQEGNVIVNKGEKRYAWAGGPGVDEKGKPVFEVAEWAQHLITTK